MFTRQRRIARTAGWMLLLLLPAAPALAQGDEVDPQVALIVEFMNDADTRAIAFEMIAEGGPQGEAATLAFASELPNLAPEARARLASALGKRGDNAAAPAIRELLDSSDTEVRLEAIGALGRVGGTDDLSTLLELVESDNESQAEAAKAALIYLRGEGLTQAFSEAVLASPPGRAGALMEILTTRRELGTIPALQELAVSDNAALRGAAMAALGQIGGPGDVAGMVQGILAAKPGDERKKAEQAVMFVCARNEDSDAQAQPLIDAMEDLDRDDRITLYSTLGRVGGAAALNTIEEAIGSDDEEIHETGIRALCNWPNASVEGRLLELARTEPHPNHRKATLRALIRVAPYADDRTPQHRLDVLRTAMAMAEEDSERELVIKRCRAIKTREVFVFVMPYMQDSQFSEQAIITLLDLAHDRGLRGDNEELFFPVLEQIKEVSTDSESRRRAQKYLNDENYFGPE